MELYTATCYELSEQLTKRYSTSFSLSSRLFDPSIRQHIYAIYGLVRLADEIVDTYKGRGAANQLDELYQETMRALHTQYSVNPIVHAFAHTAHRFGIDSDLIKPFFDSMRMDLAPTEFNNKTYSDYIYGSAEVVGLMCLRVITNNEDGAYSSLSPGARTLGAAYQKVNFLRDIAADYNELGRTYFPDVNYNEFTEADKQKIIADIERDFAAARPAIDNLPKKGRSAVRASYYYYHDLFNKLKGTPAQQILSRRIRVANGRKLYLLLKAAVGA